MRINVHAGHNFKVSGASGCFSETVEDRNVKNLVIAKLKALGHIVYDCTDEDGATQSKNLVNIVEKCNAHSVDLNVSIHFNASNGAGHGVEVLVYSDNSKAKPYAQNIVNAIANLGFTNRGVKVRTNLYVLRKTKAPSLLVECCFCDNQGDANIYNANNMADAIVKGITGQTVEVKQETATTNPTPAPQPTQQTQNTTISKGNDLIRQGQQHTINMSGHSISVDGIYGNETKNNIVRCFQIAMNHDYHKSLAIDGICGNGTKSTLGNHYVKSGERQELVRAVQVALYCHGFNPQGTDAIFGNNTKQAVIAFQKSKGLTADGIAGRNTILKLMGC